MIHATIFLSLCFLSFSFANEYNITWDIYQRLFPDIKLTLKSEYNFLENLKYIINHNSVERSYKLGITKFMHLSEEEWKGIFNNITIDNSTSSENINPLNLKDIPSSWDWRDHDVVTPVKDQLRCGSCYSFSATETVETAWAIKTGQLFVLSPQQIVDCSKLNSGCNGGLQSRVYKYLESTKQCLENSYPYTGNDGTCHSCDGAVPVLSGYNSLKAGDENSMKSSLLITSLAVAIQADQKEFQMYKSGVLDFDCGTDLDHAVSIFGFGTESGKDYWLVRNSWGTSWGDGGYVKMARGKNLCGIANSVVYPKF